jgi:hypothetical protein
VSEPNYYAIPIDQLRAKLAGLNHAGIHEIVTDSDGKIILERDHHYLGCKRCLIEEIIQERK